MNVVTQYNLGDGENAKLKFEKLDEIRLTDNKKKGRDSRPSRFLLYYLTSSKFVFAHEVNTALACH